MEKQKKIVILQWMVMCVMLTSCGIKEMKNHAELETETAVSATDGESLEQEREIPDMDVIILNGKRFYLVSGKEQFCMIGTEKYGLDENYMQQNDFTILQKEWTPIGTAERPFTGSYNGNGCKITGFISSEKDKTQVSLYGNA